MRKLMFTLVGFGLIYTANAQTPLKKSVALVTKQTGTWCVNCGTWGWPLGHDLYSDISASGNGIFMAVYDNNGPVYGTPDLVNAADATFDANFNTSGVPNFYVNGTGDPNNTQQAGWTSYTDITPALAKVNSFAATIPIVSSAANYSITGNTLTSTGKAQFWSAANGNYYMASYIVEDSVMAPQYPIASTATAIHVGVLRAQMTASSFWGEQIATGAVAANNMVTKSYTATLDPSWNQSHLRVFTVIWKQNGSQYEFVNAAKSSKGTVTGLSELANVENMAIFPNPASSNVTISFTAKNAMHLDVNITDAMGRNVYTSNNLMMEQGNNHIDISTKDFANGLYNVTLSSTDGKIVQHLTVRR